jgi:hypothetical protein
MKDDADDAIVFAPMENGHSRGCEYDSEIPGDLTTPPDTQRKHLSCIMGPCHLIAQNDQLWTGMGKSPPQRDS